MANVCVRSRTGASLLRVLAVFLAVTAGASAFADEPITVPLDNARLIKLPGRATTLVIGNPLIADVTLQPGGLAVITAKGYGATNVIALDKDGAVLSEQTLEVTGPSDPTVVVYRGVERETYSCTPECSRRITLGDGTDYFDKTLAQTGSRNTSALTAGGGQH